MAQLWICRGIQRLEEFLVEILEETLLYTPAECFHWRGSFHSLSTAGGASSLPMSRTVPGSSSRFDWAHLGLIKVIVFGAFIKVITWQKNHSPVDFRYALTVLESPTQALQVPVVYVEHHPLHVEASGNMWNWTKCLRRIVLTFLKLTAAVSGGLYSHD